MQVIDKRFAFAVTALAFAGMAGAAQADDQNMGTYSGTVNIAGTVSTTNEQVRYNADVTISLPITNRKKTTAMAEIEDEETPSATAVITQWSVVGKNTAPDADGKATTWTCELATPTTVEMNGAGTLNLDYTAKNYTLFVALESLQTIPLKCRNSRTGDYQEEKHVSLFFGTSEPNVPRRAKLPLDNPSNIKAAYQVVPIKQAAGVFSSVDMKWDLQLKP